MNTIQHPSFLNVVVWWLLDQWLWIPLVIDIEKNRNIGWNSWNWNSRYSVPDVVDIMWYAAMYLKNS